jgi:trypsin
MKILVFFQTLIIFTTAEYSLNNATCSNNVWSNNQMKCEKVTIIGGKTANITDFPYQLALIYKGVCYCGASIISKSWALTAGHCFDQRPAIKDIVFRAGSSDNRVGGKMFKIVKYFVHPYYREASFDYDGAVVKIDGTFFGTNIAKVAIIEKEKDVIAGSKVIVTGWGLLRTNGVYPRFLQKVSVRVYSQLKCKMAWMYQDIKITKK